MTEIETEADQLMEILADRGEAPVSLIAHVIGVEESVIENWARILEKRGMVEVHYPLLGKPVVEFKAADKLREEFKARFLAESKRRVELAEAEMQDSEALVKTLSSKNAVAIDREIRGRRFKVEGYLDRLKSSSTSLDVEDAELAAAFGKLIDKYKAMLSEIEEELGEEAY